MTTPATLKTVAASDGDSLLTARDALAILSAIHRWAEHWGVNLANMSLTMHPQRSTLTLFEHHLTAQEFAAVERASDGQRLTLTNVTLTLYSYDGTANWTDKHGVNYSWSVQVLEEHKL